jgi:hypothetical protein
MSKRLKKQAFQSLTSFDMFGHRISLNNGGTDMGNHKTLFGGTVSLILKVLIGLYCFQKVVTLVSVSDSEDFSYKVLLKLKDHGEVKLTDLQQTHYTVLHKQIGNKIIKLNQPDLDRYLDVFYWEETVDWNKFETREHKQGLRHEAEECTLDHFGDSALDKQIFKTWTGFSLVCLNLNSTKHIKLLGD